ncbi:MAG: hypothetical protein WAZ12_02330 [Candidatus Absconditicoccaceae bacterium]
MHQLERRILKLSTIVLFLSLLVVYALFYQVKGIQIRNKIEGTIDKGSTQIYVKNGNEKQLVGSLGSSNQTGKEMLGLIKNNVLTGYLMTGNTNSVTGNISIKTGSNTIKYLSGTKLFYGILESIEKLGIAYKYILEDQKGIYYVYLGDFKYDIVSIARKLGGNIYTINTEQEILKNKLFGDKITFINLPEYKNKIVLIIVYIGKDTWLLQVDYTLYHKSKTYLQNLFID